MIQRIQSLYLLMISLVSLFFINGTYLTFVPVSGDVVDLSFRFQSQPVIAEIMPGVWTLTILAVVIPLLALAAVFLFSKRNVQMALVKIVIVMIVAFIGATCYCWFAIISQGALPGSWFKALVPAVQLLLAIMALSGIKRDDNLVKSYDRLR